MNQKEIGELRRRMTVDKSCIETIWGCFVNSNKDIISEWNLSTAIMPQPEFEKYLALFKKLLSGTPDKNLIDLAFTTQAVLESEKHACLMKLRDTALADEEARKKLISSIIETVQFEDQNYLILLAADAYDVPNRAKDGGSHGEDSSSLFRYFLCAVCPVKEAKAELGYVSEQAEFHTCISPQLVTSPACGFLFPAFDDRQANIYDALFYSRVTSELPDPMIEAVFGTDVPMCADEQKETFGIVLADALEEKLDFEVLQNVHEKLRETIKEHKESKDPEPLVLDPSDVGAILSSSGVDDEKVHTFREKCAESFGTGMSLIPGNIVDTKKFELRTPEIRIHVDPEYSYLVETRVIDGRKFILIPADEGVEVNGVAVKVREEDN